MSAVQELSLQTLKKQKLLFNKQKREAEKNIVLANLSFFQCTVCCFESDPGKVHFQCLRESPLCQGSVDSLDESLTSPAIPI